MVTQFFDSRTQTGHLPILFFNFCTLKFVLAYMNLAYFFSMSKKCIADATLLSNVKDERLAYTRNLVIRFGRCDVACFPLEKQNEIIVHLSGKCHVLNFTVGFYIAIASYQKKRA